MIRVTVNLEPGGDASRQLVLAEVAIANITRGGGRVSSDYAWRIWAVDAKRRETVAFGCLVDRVNTSAIDLVWQVLAEWKSGRPLPLDNHGQPVRLIEDIEGFWRKADSVPRSSLA